MLKQTYVKSACILIALLLVIGACSSGGGGGCSGSSVGTSTRAVSNRTVHLLLNNQGVLQSDLEFTGRPGYGHTDTTTANNVGLSRTLSGPVPHTSVVSHRHSIASVWRDEERTHSGCGAAFIHTCHLTGAEVDRQRKRERESDGGATWHASSEQLFAERRVTRGCNTQKKRGERQGRRETREREGGSVCERGGRLKSSNLSLCFNTCGQECGTQ